MFSSGVKLLFLVRRDNGWFPRYTWNNVRSMFLFKDGEQFFNKLQLLKNMQ